MNSNLDLATRILNDFVTTGDPAALAAVCDLIEEANPEAADRVRELADATERVLDSNGAETLYWSDEAMWLVNAVLEALGGTGSARGAALRAVYAAEIVIS